MGLLSFPLPDAPRGGHGPARLHDWIREGFGPNDRLPSNYASTRFRIAFVGANQGSNGILPYEEIGKVPPHGNRNFTGEVNGAA